MASERVTPPPRTFSITKFSARSLGNSWRRTHAGFLAEVDRCDVEFQDVGRTLHRYVSGRVMHFNQDLLGAGADVRPPARTGCLSECLAERTIAREALDRTRELEAWLCADHAGTDDPLLYPAPVPVMQKCLVM